MDGWDLYPVPLVDGDNAGRGVELGLHLAPGDKAGGVSVVLGVRVVSGTCW